MTLPVKKFTLFFLLLDEEKQSTSIFMSRRGKKVNKSGCSPAKIKAASCIGWTHLNLFGTTERTLPPPPDEPMRPPESLKVIEI